jgi:trimethylamine--corrinoid protein Co-methyltransferase
VGVKVASKRGLTILLAAGATVEAGDLVRLPAELVNWAVQVAPRHVDIFNRQREEVFRVGGGAETRFGIGVTALYYQDPITDNLTPFTRKHMKNIATLGDQLSSFDLISTIGVVQDVKPEFSDLYGTLELSASTTKPLVLLVSEDKNFSSVLNLLEHLFGDLTTDPFILPYFNPISPLVINEGTAEKMFACIGRGLPFIFSNYGMAGASTPITPAGILALLNAELLAGLTLSQLVVEGTPLILGLLPAFLDMRTMANFYGMTSYLLNLACAEMMAFYELPHCGTSGSGMGWGPGLIAGAHQWANHLTSCLGKVGIAPFVGDNLGSKAFSPALIVYANEVIAQARHFAKGFQLDETSFALQDILKTGPGGDFLISESTLQNFRNAYFDSAFFPNLTMEAWLERDSPRSTATLRSHTQEMLDLLGEPDDYAALIARGEDFIKNLTNKSRSQS